MAPRGKLKGAAFQVIETDETDLEALLEKLSTGRYIMVVPAHMKSSAELRMHITFAHRYDTTDLRSYKRLVSEHATMHDPEWAHPDTRIHLHDPNVSSITLIERGEA